MRLVLSMFVAAAGCRRDDGAPDKQRAASTPSSETSTPTPAGPEPAPPSTPAPETPTPALIVDCATVPDTPLSYQAVEGAFAHKDLLFDDLGNLIGSDDASLLKYSTTEGLSVLSPVGKVNGLAWLADGDIVASSSIGLGVLRISPAGVGSVLLPDVIAFGVAVAADGTLFVGAYDRGVFVVDPTTGESVELVVQPEMSVKALALGRHDAVLYLGSIGGVWAVALDADLEPLWPAVQIGEIEDWSIVDVIGVDACDGVYFGDALSRTLYRVRPGQAREIVFAPPDSDTYAHGLEWGRGVGGWDVSTLYVSQPFVGNTVSSLNIGVPSVEWVGEVINRPAAP